MINDWTLPGLLDVLRPRGKKRAKLTYWQETAACVLLDHPDLTREQLAEIYECVRDRTANENVIFRILSHKHVWPDLWRPLILNRDKIGGEFLWVCCNNPEIRRDPEVRNRLVEEALALGQQALMVLLVSDANPADCARLFRHLPVTGGNFSAEETLVRYGQDIAHLLTLEDLRPFLASPRQDVRIAAITCLNGVEREEPEDRERSAPSR